jgi:hypothetical protein
MEGLCLTMKPGRIYYEVDLTPEMMLYTLPLLDFSREFIVVAGYSISGDILGTQCPVCSASLSPDNSYWTDDQDRIRCIECASYVDDVDLYTGVEEEEEAYSLVFVNGDDYPKYQVWLKEDNKNLRFRDVESWNIVMADNIEKHVQAISISEEDRTTGLEVLTNLRLMKPCCVCRKIFFPGGDTADSRQLCEECQDVFSERKVSGENDPEMSSDTL